MHYSVIYYIASSNLGVQLPADGVGDAEASKTVRVYIKGAYVGVMNEQFNKIKIRGMNIVTRSPHITPNSRLLPSPKQNLFTAAAAPNCFVRP